jgi:hypothetical protein
MRIIAIVLIILPFLGHSQLQLFFGEPEAVAATPAPMAIDSIDFWFYGSSGVTDSLGGAIANNEGIGTWNDLSGNGHHLSQTTNTRRPIYKTGALNGLSGAQFDGSNDWLSSAAYFWGSNDISVIVVMKFANATRDAQESIIRKGNSSGNTRQFYFYGLNAALAYDLRFIAHKDGGSSNFNTYHGSSKSSDYKIIAHASDGVGAYTLRVNGSAVSYTNDVSGTGDHTIFDNSSYGIDVGAGNVAISPVNFLEGTIIEMIGYRKKLSAEEFGILEAYLNDKYGL